MRHAFALALLVACSRPQLDDHSAILPFSELPKYLRADKVAYAPSVEDIRRFRGALPAAVPPAIAGRTPSYYGQFIGYVDVKGQRWIHGNFLCEVHALEKYTKPDIWRLGYIATNDGGDCYFHVDWSPDTNATEHLYINGDA